MPDNKDTIIKPIKGLDNNSTDTTTLLQNSQSSFSRNDNTGIHIPDVIGPSKLQIPKLEPDNKQQSSFLDDAKSTFSDKSYTPNTESGKSRFGADMPKDFFSGRYDDYTLGANNEDLAAKNQSTLSRVKNGLVKTVGTALITATQGLIEPTYGAAQGIQKGSFQAIYDNDAMKWLDEQNKKMENEFPSYVSKEETNTPWYYPTTNGLFSANFMFDKVLKNVGFMAGMAVSAATLGAVGGVLGDLMPIFGKAAAAGKLAETAIDAQNIIDDASKVSKLSEWATNLRKADLKNFNLLDKGQRLAANTFASAGISGAMALDTRNKTYDDLKKTFVKEHGYEPSDEDIKKIEDFSDGAGNLMFGLSAIISSFSFHGTLGKVMGSFGKNETKNLADNVILKQGGKEAFGADLQHEEIPEGEGLEKSDKVEYGPKEEKEGWLEDNFPKVTKVGKFTNKFFSAKAALGGAEFNVLSPGVSNYYNKKYKEGDASFLSDLIGPGLKDIFTADGLESAFIFGFVGKGFEKLGGEDRHIEENKKLQDLHNNLVAGILNQNSLIKSINDIYSQSGLKTQIEHAKRAAAIAKEQDNLDPNDILNHKDLNLEYLHNYLMGRIKLGLKSMIDDDLKTARTLISTSEGLQQFKEEKGLHKDISAEDVKKHLDYIQKVANRLQDKFEKTKVRYGSLVNRDGKTLFTPEVQEKMLIQSEKVDDYSDRIKSINNTLINKGLNTIDFLRAIDKDYGIEDQKSLLFTEIDDRFFLEERDELKKSITDLLDINQRKKDSIKEYNAIKNGPFAHQDKHDEKLVNPYSSKWVNKNGLNDTELTPKIILQTKSNDKVIDNNITLGTEYYTGKTISVPNPTGGADLRFNKFKVLHEDEDNSNNLIIQTTDGQGASTLTSVPKDFLKNHDIQATDQKNSLANFWDKNKDNLVLKDMGKKDSKGKVKKTPGELEYDPSKDQLYHVDIDGNRTKIEPKDFTGDDKITKLDGSHWDDEDKNLLNHIDEEKIEREQEDNIKNNSDNIVDTLKNQDQTLYDNDEKNFEEYDEDEDSLIKKEQEANDNISEATDRIRENRMPISRLIVSSTPLDKEYLLEKNKNADNLASLTEWLDSRKEWAERFNQFSAKLIQFNKSKLAKGTDLQDKNGNYQQPTVIFVHSGNQDALGLPGLIRPKDIENQKKAGLPEPIYMVLVHTDDTDTAIKHFIKDDGKVFDKKIGDAHSESDYDQMIFTARRGDLYWTKGKKKIPAFIEENYIINPESLELRKQNQEIIDKYTKRFNEDTEKILKEKGILEKNFYPSNGHLEKTPGKGNKRKTALSDTGQIDDNDLNHPTLQIITQKGGKIIIPEDAEYPAKEISVPRGVLFWIRGRKAEALNAAKFSKSKKDHIIDLFKILAGSDALPDVTTGKDPYEERRKQRSTISEYLASVVFFNNFFEHKDKDPKKDLDYDRNLMPQNRYDRQISIGKSRKDGMMFLMLGKDIKIPYTAESIELRRGEISTFLDSCYHIALNKELTKNSKYYEITGYNPETGLINSPKVWNNYAQYLTAKKGRDISDIPFTVDSKAKYTSPDGQEKLPIKGIYLTTSELYPESNISKQPEKTQQKPQEHQESEQVKPENKIPEINWNGSNKITINGVALDYTTETKDNKVSVEINKIDGASLESINTSLSDPNVSEFDKEPLRNIVPQFETWKNTATTELQKNWDAKVAKEQAVKEKPEEPEQVKPDPKDNPVTLSEAKQKAIDDMLSDYSDDDDKEVNLADKKRNMIISEVRKGTPLEDIQEFVDWMKKVLPQVNVKDLPYHIERLGYTWGQYANDLKTIFLSDNAIEGTGFHEAFHAVFDGFLSPKEQRKLLNEFKDRSGNYKDRFGNTREYSKATELQTIEQLADEFREHNLKNKVYKNEPVKMSFFTKLKNFFKNFFGIGKEDNINKVFNKINAGYYKGKNFYNREGVPLRNSVKFDDKTEISEQTVRALSDGFVHSLKKFLGYEKGGIVDFAEGAVSIQDLVDNVREDLNNKISNLGRKFSKEQKREALTILSPICNTIVGDNGKSSFVIDPDKWDHLMKVRFDSKLRSLGLTTGKNYADKEIDSDNKDQENDNSSTPDEKIEEVTKNTSKQLWGADVVLIDQYDTSPLEVKVLFNFISDALNNSVPSLNLDLRSPDKKTTSLLFDKIVEDNKLYYRTAFALSYCSTLDEMQEKFKELSQKVPSLVDLYNKIFGKTALKDLNYSQWRFLSRFFKSFAKYTPENVMQLEDNGRHFVASSNSDSIINMITDNWESNFKNNPSLSGLDSTGKNYIIKPDFKFTTPKAGNIDSYFSFLKEIEFKDISKDGYDSLSNTGDEKEMKDNFLKLVQKMYNQVISFQSGKNKGEGILGKDIFEAGTSIRKLAEIGAYVTLDHYASQFQRLDGEFVQTNINQNFYARVVGQIRKYKNITDFLNNNKRLQTDTWVEHSRLLGKDVQEGKRESQFFTKEGISKKPVLISNNGKVDSNGNRVLLSDMTGPQRDLYNLNGILQGRDPLKEHGIFPMSNPGDQSSEFGLEMDHYIGQEAYRKGVPKSEDSSDTIPVMKHFQNIQKGYLEDEINLIGKAEERMKYEELAESVNGSPRAKQLRYFKDILSPGLVKTITEYANKEDQKTKDLSFEDFYKTIKDNFETDIDKYMQDLVNDHFNHLQGQGSITADTKEGYFQFEELNTDFLRKFGHNRKRTESNENVFVFTPAEIMDILRFANMNYTIHNVELSKVLYADPANYKDFLKRAKMYNSGTELNFHSDEFDRAMTKEKNNIEYEGEKVELQEGDFGYRKYSPSFKGMTYDLGDSNRTKVVSKEIGFLTKALGNNKKAIEGYEQVNGADAQSYGTIDAMREFEDKAGTWTPLKEKVYQYKKAVERIKYQERLEDKEKGLRDKLFLDKEKNNIYHSHTNVLGELSERGKKQKALDEKIMMHPPIGEEFLGVFPVTKYLGAGFSGEEKYNVPNGLKTSTLNIFSHERLAKTPLEDQYLFMLKHGIDYMGPKSQHKFGRIAGSPEFYHIDTSFDKIGKLALSDLSPEEVQSKVYTQPLENYNKIVETGGKGLTDEGTLGTQLRVQAVVDMLNNSLPNDWYKPKEHVFADKKAEWDGMEDDKREAISEIYRLHNNLNKCLIGMIDQAKPQVLKALGLETEGKSGKTIIKNPEKLIKYLKDMSNNYNISSNLRDAIKVSKDKDGNDIIRLDQLSNRQSIEYITNSNIEKYIVRPKMNGGAKIEVSGEGWEKSGKSAAYKDDKGKWNEIKTAEQFDELKKKGINIQLTSNNLHFYTEGKDGKTVGMEVEVSNHFKPKMLKWAKENKKDIISDADLLAYLNSEDGKYMMQGVGFRIPSQGMNSFEVFKIKGFTDEALGDVIILPSEITTKAGSDFDVDKLNTYLKNFYINDEGLPVPIKFIKYDKNASEKIQKDQLEKIWEQQQQINKIYNNDELTEELLGDVQGKTTDELDALQDTIKKELHKLDISLSRFIKDNMGKDQYLINSREAIHNNYFDLLEETILHQSNQEKLLTPNSTHILEETSRKILAAEGAKETRNKKDINYANNLNMVWNNKNRQQVLEAKRATSISASGLTSHVMMQNFSLYVDPKIKIKLPHPKIVVKHDGNYVSVTSLSGIHNNKDQAISELGSEVVNTTVDAINNPILMTIIPSIDVFPQFLMLLRSGVDSDYASFFLKQPIIQEYIKAVNRNNTKSEEGIGRRKKVSRDEIIDNLNKVTFEHGSNVSFDMLEMNNKNNTGLVDMLTKWSSDHQLGSQQCAYQRAILKEFLTYETVSNSLLKQQQGNYWGNVKKATANNVDLKNRIKETANDGILHGLDNINKTWHGKMADAVSELTKNISSALYQLSSPDVERYIDNAKNSIADSIVKGGLDTKGKLMNSLKSKLLDYGIHTLAKDSQGKLINEEIQRLMLGDNSLANRLIRIKSALDKIEKIDPNANIVNNKALNKLVGRISNPKNPKLVTFKTKPKTINEQDDFTASLQELKEHAGISDPETGEFFNLKEFYDDFGKLGFIQSGTAPGRNAFLTMYPSEDYEQYTNQSLDGLMDKDNTSHFDQFKNLKLWWRTNASDDRVVKKINQNNRISLKNGEKYVTLPYKNNKGIVNPSNEVVKIKAPIKINSKNYDEEGRDLGTTTYREASKEELIQLRNNNTDYKENLWNVEGYSLVRENGEPKLIIINGKERYLYKPFNFWGDGKNMSEFYDRVRGSVLDKNVKVNELDDVTFINTYRDELGKSVQPESSIDTKIPSEEDQIQAQQFEEENSEESIEQEETNIKYQEFSLSDHIKKNEDINQPGELPEKDECIKK